MRMSYREKLEKADATKFEDECIDLINDYKASLAAGADADVKKQFHDDILYALDMVGKLDDVVARCDLYHQLIYEFKQIDEARAIFLKAKAAYIAFINGVIAVGDWFEASEHLKIVLENCDVVDSIEAIACFAVITMNTSDPLFPRHVAEYYVRQDRHDMASPHWRFSHDKMTPGHSPNLGADISLGLAKSAEVVGDVETLRFAWRLVVMYSLNLDAESQLVYLEQVLSCDDSVARQRAVAQLQVLLIPKGLGVNLRASEMLGDYCSVRPAEGNAHEYYRIASRQGSETAFDKAYPGASLVRCYQLAQDEDNAAAFKKLKSAYDSGQLTYRKSVGRCYLHGYGVDANPQKAAEYGVFASKSLKRRLTIRHALFWHDGSYPARLYRKLHYMVQAIGGDDLTYLLHGNKVKINGISNYDALEHSAKCLKFFVEHARSPLAQDVLDDFYETYMYNFNFNVYADWNAPMTASLNARIASGKMVYISLSVNNHAVSISFKKIDGVLYMIYNNHGQTTRQEGDKAASGHTIFRVDRPDALHDPAVMAHLSHGRLTLPFLEDLSADGAGFGKLLQLKQLAHIPRSQQKRGSCSLKLAYNAFNNQLLFHYAAAAENRLPEGKINWLAAHKQSVPMYKAWRWSIRKHSLDGLIQMQDLDNEVLLPADEHFTFIAPVVGYIDGKSKSTNCLKKILLSAIKNFLQSSGCYYLPTQKRELLEKIERSLMDYAAKDSESESEMTTKLTVT